MRASSLAAWVLAAGALGTAAAAGCTLPVEGGLLGPGTTSSSSLTTSTSADGGDGGMGAAGGSVLTGGGGSGGVGGADGGSGGEPPLAECGNGVQEPGEQCDDGNWNNEDGCLDDVEGGGTCTVARCGDGAVWLGHEECDDGNADNEDECPDDVDNGGACVAAYCGDGFVWLDHEECDDGNGSNTDGCLDDVDNGGLCQAARCGDGVVFEGVETCDDGDGDLHDDCPDGEGGTCHPATCQDGVRWTGHEECDDGNDLNNDGCSQGCIVECSGHKRGDFHCYRLFTDHLSWDDARAACMALGAGWDLAAVSSDSERDYVDGTVDPGDDCWIGGNDIQSEGDFVWSNGEPWSWADWASGEPNDSGGHEDCVEYQHHSLGDGNDDFNDLNCADTLDYLCEMTPAGS